LIVVRCCAEFVHCLAVHHTFTVRSSDIETRNTDAHSEPINRHRLIDFVHLRIETKPFALFLLDRRSQAVRNVA